MDAPLILAIDQGTTGTTAALYEADASLGDRDPEAPRDFPSSPRLPVSNRSAPNAGSALLRVNAEFPQHFPRPGWVEHDPEEIWGSVVRAVGLLLERLPTAARRIQCIGLTNQRETLVLWERVSGRPIGRAIVWQDRRTTDRCWELREAGYGKRVRELTGLIIDPYFSATKLEWLFLESPELRARASRGELCFGTIDSYLIQRMGGVRERHKIEFTNASRTLLMDVHRGHFSDELCELFRVPEACLPEIIGSTEIATKTRGFPGLPDGIPISGIAGDQHAALFGQGAVQVGQGKCTYGTGAFVLVNTGPKPVTSTAGLLTTPAWKLGSQVTYALEGACFVAGAAVQWLRDGLGLFPRSSDVEELARSVPDAGGVIFIPALTGLGAPYWQPDARGILTGLTRGTTRAHLARATLEAIAHQVADLLDVMERDMRAAGLPVLTELRVDGGASANDLLLQIQADLSRITVERTTDVESTARGAALLAGIGAGIYADAGDAHKTLSIERDFLPQVPATVRAEMRDAYHDAIDRCLGQELGATAGLAGEA